MTQKRQVEIFSAGCPFCRDTIDLINRMACPSCEISILDVNDDEVAARAAKLGIRSVPAVVVNGRPADCCVGRGVDQDVLRADGIGQTIG